MEKKEKLNKLKDISKRLTALSLAGVMGVTISSCSKKEKNVADELIAVEEQTNSIYGYGREATRDERLIDYAFLNNILRKDSKSVVGSQHYVYDRIIDWGTIKNDDSILNKSLVAKIASKRFDNNMGINIDKQYHTSNWFKKYDDMLVVPESYGDIDKDDFYDHFSKNAYIDVYKSVTGEYFVVTNLIYVCKDTFELNEVINKDLLVRLTTIDEMYYDAKKNDIITIPIAKNQYGLKSIDKNVDENGYGNIDGFREIAEEDTYEFDNNLNQKFILKK